MTAYWVSCMFQSCAPSPNNAKSREAQAPAEPEMRIVVKRKLTVGGLIGHLASVLHFHKWKYVENRFYGLSIFFVWWYPTCNFFLEYYSRFSVAPFQMWPEHSPRENCDQRTFTFL